MLRSPRLLISLVVICGALAAGVGMVYLHSVPTTQPVPSTQTSCPKNGTARAAVIAPLALGTHQNVVYIVNEHQGTSVTTSWDGTLQRYDTTTGKKTVIVKTPYMSFSIAQVSPDGQWIVFVASRRSNEGYVDELRMVRVDGQGLQTLYCTNRPPGYVPGIRFPVVWSSDQKLLAFTVEDPNSRVGYPIYLLDLASGKLQIEVVSQIQANGYVSEYFPGKWLDNTRFYVTSLPTQTGPSPMYVLDTKNGSNQYVKNLQQVVGVSTTQPWWDYDLSSDSTRLFTSHCSGRWDMPEGPSLITVQPATEGLPTTTFSRPTLTVTGIRVVNSTTLLLRVQFNGDTTQNGLWEIQTDGSNLTHLTAEGVGAGAIDGGLGEPWISISRDDNLYATDVYNDQDQSSTLAFGSLSGGKPTAISSPSKEALVYAIVGWTTM